MLVSIVELDGVSYYYVRNLLGDVIGIIDSTGDLVVKYNYKAYGECTITYNSEGIAEINPFRYKGYYYDNESGMYYCNSRYYVPEWCRWLTPDSPSFLMPDTLNGMNLFAYCGNDPVNDCDMTGNLSITVTCVLISAGISLVTEAYQDYKRDKKLFNSDNWYREYAGAIVGGAVSGLGKGFLSSVGFGVAGDMIDAAISGELQKTDNTFDFVATTIASNVIGCGLGEIASSVGKRFASTIKANQIYKSKATMKNSAINKELRKITNDLNIGAKKATVKRIADELYSSGKWEFGERLARIIGLAF